MVNVPDPSAAMSISGGCGVDLPTCAFLPLARPYVVRAFNRRLVGPDQCLGETRRGSISYGSRPIRGVAVLGGPSS
jgi:hypothetical protein